MFFLLVLIGCGVQPESPRPGGIPVVLGPVSRGAVAVTVTLPGELQGLSEASLGFEVAGLVKRVLARVGDRVVVGDVLVGLDDRSAVVALRAARAREEQAAADVALRSASLMRVEAELNKLRLVRGATPGAISAQELLSVELAWKEAEALLQGAQAARRLREAERAQASLDVERCQLRSPVSGVVARQDARVGQRVLVGAGLVDVVGLDAAEVLLSVGSEQAGMIEVGSPVSLSVLGKAALVPVQSVVAGLVPSVGESRSQLLRVDVSPLPAGWLPGQAVEGVVVMRRVEVGVQVPRDAVVGGAVFGVSEGKAQKIPVLVQHDLGENLLVVGVGGEFPVGLSAVVVRGNEALQDGSVVVEVVK